MLPIRRRLPLWRLVVSSLVCTVWLASGRAPEAAARPVDDATADLPTSTSHPLTISPVADALADELAGSDLAPDGWRSYNVRLIGPSLAEVVRLDKEAAKAASRAPMGTDKLKARLASMEARQAPLAARISALGVDVVGSYQAVMNGFLVHATPDQAEAIRHLPGVVGVTRAPIHRLDLKDSVPMIGAQKVIDDLKINGSGVTVAIIDTGIDYIHADLGGSGSVPEYNINDENVIEPGTFPTKKVIGGYDFAGQRYTPACPQNPPTTTVCSATPKPDDDPLDTSGHGSHVSGIVAGIGTPIIHNGVAPGASLVGLKVFGTPINVGASTDLVGRALEWATKHNMGLPVPGNAPPKKIDVINMSLGSSGGSDWTEDCAAVKAAHESGITVVASSGNSGATPFIAGTPSICRDALSVASSFASGEMAQAIHNTWEENGKAVVLDPDALTTTGPWTPSLAARGIITAPLAYYGRACNDEAGMPSAPAQDVKEKIALIERGPCSFYEKFTNAAKLGAIAVVMFSDTRPKAAMACLAPSPCTVSPGIPGVMIDAEPGARLRDVLLGGATVTTVLDPNYTIELEYLTDTISGFSSRGPGRVIANLKPQITAPGSNIESVGAGTGTGMASLSGTSMSSPTVAGVAALLWNRNYVQGLEMSAGDIAALAMNYAIPVIKINRADTGPLGAVARQGAGRSDAYKSAVGKTLVRSDDGFAGLGYANLYATDDMTHLAQTLKVRNMSGQAKTYKPSFRMAFDDDQAKGVSYSFEPSMLTVPANQSANLAVSLDIDAKALREWPGRVTNWVSSEAFLGTYEMDGQVVLTEVDAQGQAVKDGDKVGLPFYMLPRRRSCVMAPSPSTMQVTKDQPVTLTWSNPCTMDGTVQPSAAVFTDPAESATDPSFLAKADIDTIGVRWGQDPMTTTKRTMLEFRIHTQAGRTIPADTAFTIFLDLNNDGGFDRAMSYRGAANEWLVAHAPVITNTLAVNIGATSPISFPLLYDLGETTTILRASAESLGLDFDSGNVRFGFAVRQNDTRAEKPASPTYPSYDDAPNGIKAAAGPTYVVDQAEVGCVQLTGADGKSLTAYGSALAVPGKSMATASYKYTCAAPATKERLLLSAFPLNAAGNGEMAITKALFGPISIFIPSANQTLPEAGPTNP